MAKYEGAPNYEDIPLGYTEAELARGAGSNFDELLAQRRAQAEAARGAPRGAAMGGIVGYGDPRHEYGELDVPGTEYLRPFPDGQEGCSDESVRQRIPCYPHERVVQRGLRIFSLWGDDGGGTAGNLFRRETPQRWMSYRLVESPIVPDCGSQLWSIDLWGYEVARNVAVATPPLTPADILRMGGAAPRDDPGNASTRLKARVQWAAASGGETRIIDIAQGIRLSLEACLVTVEILYPFPASINFDGAQPLLGEGGGTILDSEIGVQIVPTVSTAGQQLATNTMVVQVLAGQTDIPILLPPGTRHASLIQTANGAPMVPRWDDGRDPVNPGNELGQINMGGIRRVDSISRPGNAGSIRTGPADPDFDRWLTVIFELEI